LTVESGEYAMLNIGGREL